MKKKPHILRSFFPLYNNIVFRFFLGIALYCLSAYIILHYVRDILSFKMIALLGVYAGIYYTFFSMIDGCIERIASFHFKKNNNNINKQPIKWFLLHKEDVSRHIKLVVNILFAYVCFDVLLSSYIK